MIDIKDKKECVGCNACTQKCPTHCIDMIVDEQGFKYPKVDVTRCIGCELCERVCPVINLNNPQPVYATYAAWNLDDNERITSSSGGVFMAIAKYVINGGGVVFGAVFNENWEVNHAAVETIEELKFFQGSKYVQSDIKDSFVAVEKYLKSKRRVLFSGTPCQISGLKKFLIKDWGTQLITVDVACHGVPSPKVWASYLKHVKDSSRPKRIGTKLFTPKQGNLEISDISFRDKRSGWMKYGLSIEAKFINDNLDSKTASSNFSDKDFELLYEPFGDNLFLQLFNHSLGLRPSCYSCPSKCGRSCSDLTIADFWKVQNEYPSFYSEKGVSAIILRSSFIHDLLFELNLTLHQVEYKKVLKGNLSLEMSAKKHALNDLYWLYFQKFGIQGIKKIKNMLYPDIIHRIANRIKKLYIKA